MSELNERHGINSLDLVRRMPRSLGDAVISRWKWLLEVADTWVQGRWAAA